MPYVLYQVWAFVAPGLYRHEKRFALPLLLSSIVLFYVGVAFAYYAVFPAIFAFFATTGPHGVLMMTDINNYLDFVLMLFFAFGIAFEVPVADGTAGPHRNGQGRDSGEQSRLCAHRHLRHRRLPHAARTRSHNASWRCRCTCCTRSASSCRESCSRPS